MDLFFYDGIFAKEILKTSIMSIKWNVDKNHAQVQFRVKHMVISNVSGEFQDFDASVETDDENFTNPKFEFTAKIHSINTKVEARNNHLKSADFFDADKYPEMKFVSTKFDGDSITGNLTIKNVTKPITLDADFGGVLKEENQIRAGVEFTGSLSRKDFNLLYNPALETGGAVVGDKIRLQINMEFLHEK